VTMRFLFLPSTLLSSALVALPVAAAPMDGSQVSIGSRGDGEVIVINDCRPGSIRWNIDGEIHCVGVASLPPSTPPPSQGDPDRGIGGGCGRAPSSGPVAACGGGTRRPSRAKCLKKAEEWHKECEEKTVAFREACVSSAYDLAIAQCTSSIPTGADAVPRDEPCTGPLWDAEYSEADQAWIMTPRKNAMGKPIHWDPIANVACDDPRGCAGSWLHGRPGATVSSGAASSWGTNGSMQIGLPGFGANVGGSQGGSESMTVEIKYDPREGAYQSCGNGTSTWMNACFTKKGELEAQCPR
jgi:hypothetical protein